VAVENMADYSTEFESSRVNVGNVERWISLAAGSALAAYGARRRDFAGSIAAATANPATSEADTLRMSRIICMRNPVPVQQISRR